MKNVLKAWLKKNELTSNPNDYIAVISPMGSINKKGLIQSIIDEGIELKAETIEDVITRYNRHAAQHAVNGWNVDTGLVYLRPVVTGAFYGKKFDPGKNSVYISATQGLDIRKEIAQTEVELLGEAPDVMSILQVINLQSKLADGTLVRGRNTQVEGAYIKVAGDDPAVGVYLTNIESNAVIKLEQDHLVVNDPSKLILLIPADVPVGTYLLKVCSQFISGKRIRKMPREIVFGQELNVV
jgi:hypothetical protein